MVWQILSTGEEQVLVLLKKEALAGQVADYPTLFNYTASLIRRLTVPVGQITKAELYRILLVYLRRLGLAGGVESYITIYNKIKNIVAGMLIVT